MTLLLKLADGVSRILFRLAEMVTLVLVASMIYEVVARYAFGAPTLWAFDISYMATGILFVLGAAYTLRQDAHVRIDFLAEKMPATMRARIEGILFLFFIAPVFGSLAYVGIVRALRAYENNEVEMVSPWAPLMWPFYAFIALGLVALTLQIVAHALRAFLGRTEAPFQIET